MCSVKCQKLLNVCMYMCVFKFFFEITEPTEDKVYVGPPRDRGENLFKCFRSVVVLYFNFVSPRGRGLLAGILPQIWPGCAGLLAGL